MIATVSECHLSPYHLHMTTCQTLTFAPHILTAESNVIIEPILIANIHIKTFSYPIDNITTLTGYCDDGYTLFTSKELPSSFFHF